MKLYVSTLLITLFTAFQLIPASVLAQGNLQFNQVLLISSSQTVPTGKVWKVESALANSTVTPAASQSHMNSNGNYILVNGNAIAISSSFAGWGSPGSTWLTGPGIGTHTDLTHFPFWLPAGISLAPHSGVTYLSVVEFNVIP